MKFALVSAIVAVAVASVLAQRTPPISHEYANVNGQRLHYARAGSGPLVVFLHGFPEFWYEWKHQIAEFSRDHTVVAPDMRGYNLSSKPAEVSAYAMPNLVEDVRALTTELLKSTGGTKFTLVAHDWGGVVAWVFAALHPEMVEKLVIVNAPHPTIFGRAAARERRPAEGERVHADVPEPGGGSARCRPIPTNGSSRWCSPTASRPAP